jgi:hypothetical protein
MGVPEETIIKSNNGLFMVLPSGEHSLLAVSLREGANLGLVRIEARDAAREIGELI